MSDGYWSGPMGTWRTGTESDQDIELKMLPGQTPYTEDERYILGSLVSDAARAEELVDIEELDHRDNLIPR